MAMSLAFHIVFAVVGIGMPVLMAIGHGRVVGAPLPLARGLAMAQVTLILWGWGLAQFPYLVGPDLTFEGAAAPDTVLRPLVITLGAGGVVTVPALACLLRVFKAPAP
jgi:hypothetical protein